jgi:L-rhamnonate dehydratase
MKASGTVASSSDGTQADTIAPYFGKLFKDEPLPANGFIDLPDRPGFGVTLDRDRNVFKRPYARTPEEVAKNIAANTSRPVPQRAFMPL